MRWFSDAHERMPRENSRTFDLNKSGKLYRALGFMKFGVPGYNVSAQEILNDVIDGLESGEMTYKNKLTQSGFLAVNNG